MELRLKTSEFDEGTFVGEGVRVQISDCAYELNYLLTLFNEVNFFRFSEGSVIFEPFFLYAQFLQR